MSPSLKLAYLDGLRGLAALAVLSAHFRELFAPGFYPRGDSTLAMLAWTPFTLAIASSTAVKIFFFHSGFVLAWKYFHTGDTNVLISMAARRFFRLGIPVAVAVIFAYALMSSGAMRSHEVPSASGSVWEAAYRFEPTLASAAYDALGGWFWSHNLRYNGALWTMPLELTYSYVVFALAPVLIRARRLTATVGGAVLSICLLASPFALGSYFVLGSVIARVWCGQKPLQERGQSTSPLSRILFALVVGSALVVAAWPHLLAHSVPPLPYVNRIDLLQLPTVAVLFGALLLSPRAQRALGTVPMQFLGRNSFSAYLLHIPILCSFSSTSFLFFEARGYSHSLSVVATFAATLVVVYGCAELMSRTVDLYAIEFGKSFLARHLAKIRHGSGLPQPVGGQVLSDPIQP